MTPTIKNIPIAKIRRDSGAQFRPKGINPSHVMRLREALQNGEVLPPVVLFFDKKENWMADGDHRIEAHLLEEHEASSCRTRHGLCRA